MKIIKTMRDVRALAKSPDVDSVNAYAFRSAEEIRVYLDELLKQVEDTKLPDQNILGDAEAAVGRMMASVTVVASHRAEAATPSYSIDRHADPAELLRRINERTRGTTTTTPRGRAPTPNVMNNPNKWVKLDESFNVTNTGKLDSQFGIVKDLHNKLEVLDAMELTIKQAFAGERSPLGTQVTKTRKAVETKLKAALAFISKAAQKKEPKQFAAAVDPTVTKLLELADGKYKKPAGVTNYLFTKTDKTGALFFIFQRHVVLSNFSSDEDSFTYPQYVIVFTAAVSNDRRMTMHVTTLHHARPPGTFKFGATFMDEKSALRELDALLDMDKVVDLMTKAPLGAVSLDRAKFSSKQYIADVRVDEDHVRITTTKKMPVTPEARLAIIMKIFLDLKTLLKYGKSQSLKYKVRQQADKSVVLDFVVVPNSTGRGKSALDDRQVRLLKTHFGFDDEDVSSLVRVLQRGY